MILGQSSDRNATGRVRVQSPSEFSRIRLITRPYESNDARGVRGAPAGGADAIKKSGRFRRGLIFPILTKALILQSVHSRRIDS